MWRVESLGSAHKWTRPFYFRFHKLNFSDWNFHIKTFRSLFLTVGAMVIPYREIRWEIRCGNAQASRCGRKLHALFPLHSTLSLIIWWLCDRISTWLSHTLSDEGWLGSSALLIRTKALVSLYHTVEDQSCDLQIMRERTVLPTLCSDNMHSIIIFIPFLYFFLLRSVRSSKSEWRKMFEMLQMSLIASTLCKWTGRSQTGSNPTAHLVISVLCIINSVTWPEKY